MTLVENPPTDLLKGVGTPISAEGSQRAVQINDEQRAALLAAVGKNHDSKIISATATGFYGMHGSIGFGSKENRTIDLEIADSTDRYAANLRFGLQDSKTGKATARPVAVSVSNLKTVAIEFKPIGERGSARPSLLVVKPRILFPFEEGEVKE
jgi:hypothetical protein